MNDYLWISYTIRRNLAAVSFHTNKCWAKLAHVAVYNQSKTRYSRPAFLQNEFLRRL